MKDILVMLMAGGRGKRLYPLTRDRAKPSTPFGGIYRVIDFTLSNCINSDLRKIYVLTQYKSVSLERHIRLGWSIFSREMGEFVETIPPQQRISDNWYQGTADAIYQNIYTLENEKPKITLILSGDHVYKMDYRDLIGFHVKKNADLTISAVEMDIEQASHFGIMEVDEDMRIIGFQEKPKKPKPLPGNPDRVLASMGVYVFNTEPLVRNVVKDARSDTSHDFGKDVITQMIKKHRVYCYPYTKGPNGEDAYWRDIGTVDSYYEANMDLVDVLPKLNLYDELWPIRTHQEQVPPVKTVYTGPMRQGQILESIVGSGSIISGGHVERSILSHNVRVHSYAEVLESIIMEGVNVGRHARVRRAIIDKDVFIPPETMIGFDKNNDGKRFKVSDGGIVVIPKGYIIK